MFSGAAGLTYGSDNVMQFYIPELFSPSGSGPAQSWAVDIGLPGSAQMQHIQRVVIDRARNGTSRIPDQSIILGNAGINDQRVTVLRDRNGTWIMVYTPTGAPFKISTSNLNITGGKLVKASWFDTLNGTYTGFDWTVSGESTFTPPKSTTHVDWVLILEVKA